MVSSSKSFHHYIIVYPTPFYCPIGRLINPAITPIWERKHHQRCQFLPYSNPSHSDGKLPERNLQKVGTGCNDPGLIHRMQYIFFQFHVSNALQVIWFSKEPYESRGQITQLLVSPCNTPKMCSSVTMSH